MHVLPLDITIGTWRSHEAASISVHLMDNKTTIEDLEDILSSGKEYDIELQPDGSIRAVEKGTAKDAVVIRNKLGDVVTYY